MAHSLPELGFLLASSPPAPFNNLAVPCTRTYFTFIFSSAKDKRCSSWGFRTLLPAKVHRASPKPHSQ